MQMLIVDCSNIILWIILHQVFNPFSYAFISFERVYTGDRSIRLLWHMFNSNLHKKRFAIDEKAHTFLQTCYQVFGQIEIETKEKFADLILLSFIPFILPPKRLLSPTLLLTMYKITLANIVWAICLTQLSAKPHSTIQPHGKI